MTVLVPAIEAPFTSYLIKVAGKESVDYACNQTVLQTSKRGTLLLPTIARNAALQRQRLHRYVQQPEPILILGGGQKLVREDNEHK